MSGDSPIVLSPKRHLITPFSEVEEKYLPPLSGDGQSAAVMAVASHVPRRQISLVLPGRPIPWNDAHLAQPFKRENQRWSARFVTAPRAREMKLNVRDMVRRQLVKTGAFDKYWRSRSQYMVGVVYYGRWFYVNPFVRVSEQRREKYKSSWHSFYVHETFLAAHSLSCAQHPGFSVPETQVFPLKYLVSLARSRWRNIDLSRREFVDTASRYAGGSKRSAPFATIIQRDGDNILFRAADFRRMIDTPHEHFERRDIDVDALQKLIQDSIFEALFPDRKRTDAWIDGYHYVYRYQTILPQDDRIMWVFYDR